MYDPTRRRLIQVLGAGSVAAMAGCLSTTPEESNPEPTDDSADEDEDTGLPDAKPVNVDRIAADPTDVPPPVDWTGPRRHEIPLRTEEHVAEIEPGVTFDYMTFEGQIPGPMIRVRRGDTIHLTFEVPADLNVATHNVDFHAVYGPGGGAKHTTISPGDDAAEIEFRAMYPGVHIYHCAIPNMDHHISPGMFGAILVAPEDGLPEVDRELYFGQHELYTSGDAVEEGHHRFDFDAARREDPTYVLVNGEVGAFTDDGYGPITVDKGERVRIYLANGGPNLMCSWHPIGNVWETFYRDGDLYSDPDRFVETAPVAPGTVAAAEIDTPVPGPIKLVDHALSRVLRKGRLAVIAVKGSPEPDIFNPDP